MKFVNNVNDFQQNLKIRFFSDHWLNAIDFDKFFIVGGCVVNALCQSPFPDTQQQDINIINTSDSLDDREKAIEDVVEKLRTISAKYSNHSIKVEKIPGSWHYNIFLPCGIKLNFTHMPTERSENGISHLLYSFDMDICQVAFTGNFFCNILCILILMVLCRG